ncbi:MAG: aminoacyl--tRNA ligase-related protein [Candidatus Thermoplasmatota archaeon]|nr:aminoacyl--tRNA ligase-related protein [Candidatus Thermoplasmatota archaeon]
MGAPRKAKRGIPPKSDFNSWYPSIVEIADLVDKRYPIKGMDVWKPYGLKAMSLIDGLAREQMALTDHHEHRFPLLVPENLLDKENKLVSRLKAAREAGVDPSELRMEEEDSGFKKEVYWVTHGGENELEAPMFLRPTSETPMYTMFSLWVRSHSDLPLKTFQIVNTFRYETKQTRSFIRVREIHFFEAHTVHKDEKGATEQISEDAAMVQRILHDLCLPSLVSKRPVWDTFPGAWYTMAADVVMPNGRTLQVATYHHYRDQWARAFDLKYEDQNGENQFCHQTTFGMSERLLGSLVGMHGDDKGLIMPPAVAPYQVVLLPIASHVRDDVIPAIHKIRDSLNDAGLRTYVDDRDVRPGVKHYDWEIKGVPIRLELGPRDIDSGNCIISERTGKKYEAPISDILNSVNSALVSVADVLRDRAGGHFSDLVSELPEISNVGEGHQFTSPIVDGMVYSFPFCGTDSDAEILEKLSGLTMLGECVEEYDKPRKCVITGKKTTKKQHLARMY